MISFEFCDFKNPAHQEALCFLLNHYMEDPMGDHEPLDAPQQAKLIEGLDQHPTAEVLFVLYDGKYAGLTTTFVNYSTFNLKPYLYIHDVVVLDGFRGKGIGRALINEWKKISKERDYCKITLEVREDNHNALHLYNSLGFVDCDPKMYFWTCKL